MRNEKSLRILEEGFIDTYRYLYPDQKVHIGGRIVCGEQKILDGV